MENIPDNYTYCYATDEQCTLAAHCLHCQAARSNEKQENPQERLLCITPTYVAKVAAGMPCAHYHDATPLRYAKGMIHLFDAVPKSSYSYIQDCVMSVFSSRRIYYYARRGERLITPAQQKCIIDIFTRAGLAAPTFDSYVMQPNWFGD